MKGDWCERIAEKRVSEAMNATLVQSSNVTQNAKELSIGGFCHQLCVS
jgi:hypothetical protein